MADDPKNQAQTDPALRGVSVHPRARAGRRQHAPAAERNAAAIISVLKDCLPAAGAALEIASGTGQHVAAFARAFGGIAWTPSDPAPGAFESIAAWSEQAGAGNVRAPLDIDVMAPGWEMRLEARYDAILAINLIHIAPWDATEGLLRGAAALLAPDGFLYLYGPFKRDQAHTSQSNAEFDRWLRAQDGAWGVRDIGEVENAARGHGLQLDAAVAMPANNFSLIFRERPVG